MTTKTIPDAIHDLAVAAARFGGPLGVAWRDLADACIAERAGAGPLAGEIIAEATVAADRATAVLDACDRYASASGDHQLAVDNHRNLMAARNRTDAPAPSPLAMADADREVREATARLNDAVEALLGAAVSYALDPRRTSTP